MCSHQAAVFTSNTTISETDLTYDGQDIVIDGPNVTVAIDGPHAFNSLLITNGAILTHSPCTASETHKLDLAVTNQILISTNSRIDVTGKGYLAGRTTGNTTVGGASGYSGGSYGGLGWGFLGVPNAVYGDYADPNDWGSGSGTFSTHGVPGGGLLRITAGSVVLDGQLLANGGGGDSACGSGGGIYVASGVLRGSGLIQAAGGNGGGAAAGGGRVAVYAGAFSGFNLNAISAPGRFPGISSAVGAGSPGTVLLRNTNDLFGTLVIDAGNRIPGDPGSTPLGLPGKDKFAIPDAVVIGAVGRMWCPSMRDWLWISKTV